MRVPSLLLLLAASSAARLSPEQLAQSGALDVVLAEESERALVIQLDRPLYRPGDLIWFRIWDLDLRDLTGDDEAGVVEIELLDVQGKVVQHLRVRSQRGAAMNAVRVPGEALGGVWRLRATASDGRERTHALNVASYMAPPPRDTPPQIALTFQPEGGALVEGLESRVYFAATGAHGAPVAVTGRVLDDTGAVVATFESVHDGMGRFAIVPRPGRSYHAELDAPSGVEEGHPLPAASADGCVLRPLDGRAGGAVRARVQCAQRQDVLVVGTLHGQVLGAASVVAGPRRPVVVRLAPEDPALARTQGVARVTALTEDLEPLAEGLVHRDLGQRLDIQVEADQERYGPRDKVTLRITTRDPGGRPVPAELALSVVDDALLAYLGDARPSLLASLYLAPVLASAIHDPGYYFDPGAEERDLALEMLLGARGGGAMAVRYAALQPPEDPPVIVLPRNKVAPLPEPPTPPVEAITPSPTIGSGGLASRGPGLTSGGTAYHDEGLGSPGRGSTSPGYGSSGGFGIPKFGSKEPTGRLRGIGGDPIILGALDRAPLEQVLEQNLDAILACYERELEKDPELGGKVVMKFVITKDGTVTKAAPKVSTLGNQAAEACLTSRLLDLRFPEPKGGGIVIVSYPFRFSPEGGSGRSGGEPMFVPLGPEGFFRGLAGPSEDVASDRAFPPPHHDDDGAQRDVRETVMWAPRVTTDAQGTAEVELWLSDLPTTFRVTVEGVGAGLAGHAEALLVSEAP
ncbi:MAG: AgmX/PglI C-terminal domain-containing protein [Alphaproteobacteria bacterium]|nr:AgmX/PglI C-terminal domain-containing protein [Alphaproteobacteria bacterium]